MINSLQRFWGRAPAPLSQLHVRQTLLKADVAAFAHFWDFLATGASIWPSTAVLAHYMGSEALRPLITGARVLELGSGLGLAGMATAIHGAKSVCLTDRLVPRLAQLRFDDEFHWEPPASSASPNAGSQQQLEALKATLVANRSSLPFDCHMSVEELAFGDLESGRRILKNYGPFDLVLGSDITYSSPALPDLLRTLKQVAGQGTLVLLGHSHRRPGLLTDLCAQLEEAGFAVETQHQSEVAVLECTKVRCAASSDGQCG